MREIMYLPFPTWKRSCDVLKKETLGQMRISAQKIFYRNREDPDPLDPAVSFWKGFEYSLAMYQLFCIQEFIDRGGPNDILPLISEVPRKEEIIPSIGDILFHLSQKSILAAVDREYKEVFGGDGLIWYEYWPHLKGGNHEEDKLRERALCFKV